MAKMDIGQYFPIILCKKEGLTTAYRTIVVTF